MLTEKYETELYPTRETNREYLYRQLYRPATGRMFKYKLDHSVKVRMIFIALADLLREKPLIMLGIINFETGTSLLVFY
jgi:hypothetical protein